MNKIVVYKSVLGTSQKYSEGLSQKIGADLSRWYVVNRRDFAKYDLVVVCTGPYENWEPLAKYLEKNWDVLKDKHVVVMAVGEIPSEEGVHWKPEEKIPEQIVKKIKIFELPGKLNPATAKDVSLENVEPVAEYIRGLEAGDTEIESSDSA